MSSDFISIVAALAGIFSRISEDFFIVVPQIGQVNWLLKKVDPHASQVCIFDWILFQENHPIPPNIKGIKVTKRNNPPAKSIMNFPAGVGKINSKIKTIQINEDGLFMSI